jgi:predicted nucleic acid-binding protein
MRIVLDTDVVVRALRSPESASAALIKAARQGRVTLLASLANALEYEDVLARAHIVAGTPFTP